MGIRPQNLNFDLRLLNPGQFSAPYHFHRHAEELFMVVSGTMTLRTPERLEIVNRGDIIFFEMGVTGAHQFYNHGSEPCIIWMFEPSSAMMCANTLIPGNCCWLLRMRYSTKDPN
ncbi:cupin domain-containing protein [Mariniphaga sediminis]|uniref:cupin domain-containing protein n=1 Tax=Mariniphaga sediminis TaxID=1628158 RepID=UPI003743AE7F